MKLRAELKSRGLDASGLKPALVARLQAALADSANGENQKETDKVEEEKEEDPKKSVDDAEPEGEKEEKEEEEEEEGEKGNDDGEEMNENSKEDEAVDNDDASNAVFDIEENENGVVIVQSNRLANARNKIARNPYDANAWEVFFVEARGRPSVTKDVFEEILRFHPRCVKAWIAYAESAMEKKDDVAVSEIFSRCLQDVLAPELWFVYVNYAKETNEVGKTEEGARAIKAAFEYCVDHVGEDIESGKIWEEYLNFLKGVKAEYIAVRVT